MTRPGARPTALYHLYRSATRLLSPVAYKSVSKKLERHNVPENRRRERLGKATQTRPDGPLVWFHAASVGESLSVLTLITRMGERLPHLNFLITSGTATSAALVEKRMPPRTRHQFAPLDTTGAVHSFYDHWAPEAGIIVESELWPQILTHGRARGVALALLNARLSEKSVRGWKKVPATARFILDQFSVILTQNRKTADNLLAMGADPARVQVGINLKSTSAPLPVDPDTLNQLQDDLNGRPVWVGSSTHPGEEEILLGAHKTLLKNHPDLCLLLVPRHPERGDEIAALIEQSGMSMARRSRNQSLSPQTQIYMADTLGETGTWYALSPLVFLGGSLLPIGGHNPFEPAQAGAAVLTGPHVTNFSETFSPLISVGGAREVSDAPELAQAIDLWLTDAAALDAARKAATNYVSQQQSKLDEVIDILCEGLGLERVDG